MRRTIPFALIAVLALQACGGDASGETADGTSGTTANLLDSRTDPGVGGPSVPTAGARSTPGGAPSALARPQQDYDISQLGYNSGPAEAPVRIVEFSDFGCSYCRQFHEEVYHSLEESYMETGKVEWKYVPMILGIFPNAMEAGLTGECAGQQGQFPVMRDHLFEVQSEWKNSSDPMPLMFGYAEETGLDMAEFRACVEGDVARDKILAGTRISQQVGVRGTPTFFIVGYQPIPGMIPQDLFEQVLDTVYAEAISGRGPGG